MRKSVEGNLVVDLSKNIFILGKFFFWAVNLIKSYLMTLVSSLFSIKFIECCAYDWNP